MKYLFLHIFLAIIGIFALQAPLFSQKSGIKGRIVDSEQAVPLEAASVALLLAVDSSMVSFALSDSAGGFQWASMAPDRYRLVATYVGYAPFDTVFSLGKKQRLDLGSIRLKARNFGLGEVEILAKATPIIMRNDTIFFNASSFKTDKNDAVLELLRGLPGIEVDDEGNIRAMGKAVLNILVDGKPFFNGDQGTTTRVLPADAIQTVEVYDQTSKESDFTGVEDGKKEKTINLVLKEDRKKGWFGSVAASSGGSKTNDQRHAYNTTLNRFSPKIQTAIVGNFSNLSEGVGVSGFQRNQLLMADFGYNRSDDNSTFVNYNFNGNQVEQRNEVARQVIADGGGFTTQERNRSKNGSFGHSVSFNSSHNRDTTRYLFFNGNFNSNTNDQWMRDTTASANSAGRAINEGIREKTDRSDAKSASFSLQWGQQVGKKGSNFMISPSFSHVESTLRGDLLANNTFYQTDSTTTRLDTVRQVNRNRDRSTSAGLGVEWNQQLREKIYLQVGYSYGGEWQTASLSIADLQALGEERLNDSLSSDYTNYMGMQQVELELQFDAKKWHWGATGGMMLSRIKGINSNPNQLPIDRRFATTTLGANADYEVSEGLRSSFNYYTMGSQPSESMLQPVPDRSDPLNVRYGNPNLRPEQSHNLSWSINQYHPTKFHSISLSADLGATQRKIVDVITIDDQLVRSYRPENTPGSVSAGLSLSANKPIKKTKGSLNANLGATSSKGRVFLNDRLNSSTEQGWNVSASCYLRPIKWLSLNSSVRMSHNRVLYSVAKQLEQSYTNYGGNVGTTLRFPKKFYIESSLNVTATRGLANGFNRTVPIWNCTVSRNFLKNEQLALSITANDLLNRSIGVNRQVSLNTIEDRKSAVLSRYFLLNISYSFRQI